MLVQGVANGDTMPWSHHLIILGQSKRPEERHFYVRLAIREKWSKRELQREFKTAWFERAVFNPSKSPLIDSKAAWRHIHPPRTSRTQAWDGLFAWFRIGPHRQLF